MSMRVLIHRLVLIGVGALLVISALALLCKQRVLDIIAKKQRAINARLYRDFASVVGPVTILRANESNAPTSRVECARTAAGTFKTLALGDHLDALRQHATRERLDLLLADVLPHLTLGGRELKLSDLVVIDVMQARGAYFPSMHTDIEWTLYPASGFQVWYLLQSEDTEHGNMFLFDTDLACGGGASVAYDDTGLRVRTPDARGRLSAPRSLEIDRAYYLGLAPGECVVFGQNMLHMSDFRPPAGARRAINFRVLIRDTHDRVPFYPLAGSIWTVLFQLPYRLLHAFTFWSKCNRRVCPLHGIGV